MYIVTYELVTGWGDTTIAPTSAQYNHRWEEINTSNDEGWNIPTSLSNGWHYDHIMENFQHIPLDHNDVD